MTVQGFHVVCVCYLNPQYDCFLVCFLWSDTCIWGCSAANQAGSTCWSCVPPIWEQHQTLHSLWVEKQSSAAQLTKPFNSLATNNHFRETVSQFSPDTAQWTRVMPCLAVSPDHIITSLDLVPPFQTFTLAICLSTHTACIAMQTQTPLKSVTCLPAVTWGQLCPLRCAFPHVPSGLARPGVCQGNCSVTLCLVNLRFQLLAFHSAF